MNTNPLFYFEQLLESNNLRFRSDTAINKLIEKYGSLVKSVDYEKGCVDYLGLYSDGSVEPIEKITTYSFYWEFQNEVKRESDKLTTLIDSIVLNINMAGNNSTEFLKTIITQLTLLIEKSKLIYPEQTFIKRRLIEVSNKLIKKYSLEDIYNYQEIEKENSIAKEVNNHQVQLNSISEFIPGKEIELIQSIFGFMSGLNERAELILDSTDYELLIKYNIELVKGQSVPIIERRLNPNVSKIEMISFPYWVMHKALYTTHRIKPYFYNFIKEVFINFDATELSSLQGFFGTKTRLYSHHFLPQIIKEYLD